MVFTTLEPMVAEANRLETDLGNLEKLGAYFTSQIHDLNNQVAVLSNAELLHSLSDLPVEKGTATFLEQLFTSIRRLSATSDRLNDVRKVYPLTIPHISCAEATTGIRRIVEAMPGWTLTAPISSTGSVSVNPRWIGVVIGELLARTASVGKVTLSVGELPVRHYQQVLRQGMENTSRLAFLVHFRGEREVDEIVESATNGDYDYEIALELVRLMGAGLSLGLSDDPFDVLLAFRFTDECN